MAFATPDPKKVEAQRRRVDERKAQDIAILEQRRKMQVEIRACYHEHTPTQIANASKMIENGKHSKLVTDSVANGEMCWQRIGRSNGGKTRRNLYRCMVVG